MYAKCLVQCLVHIMCLTNVSIFFLTLWKTGRGCSFSEDTFKKIKTTYMESRKYQKSESGTNTKFKNQIVNKKNIESDILQMLVLFLAASFSMELLG